jgi:hypothetical protein
MTVKKELVGDGDGNRLKIVAVLPRFKKTI